MPLSLEVPSVDDSALGGGGGHASVLALPGILLGGGVAGGGKGGFLLGFCPSVSERDLSVDGSCLAVFLLSFDFFSDFSFFDLSCDLRSSVDTSNRGLAFLGLSISARRGLLSAVDSTAVEVASAWPVSDCSTGSGVGSRRLLERDLSSLAVRDSLS